MGALPTARDDERDAAKRENERTEKNVAKLDAEHKRQIERARRAMPDEAERRRGCVDGMKRYAKRADREGDPDRARKLSKHADEAEAALREYETHTKALQAKRPDPLGDAMKAAARELRKSLKACFPSEADALQFARTLPLIEAKAEAGRVADGYAKIARERGKTDRDFWAAVNAGGRLAIGMLDDDANARRLIEAAGL